MGTDIHGVFQRHDEATGQWHDVPSNYAQERHYQLFAVLAGVRNGRGFAGVVTGEPVKPIAEPRGYPEDFVSECPDVFGADGDHLGGGEDHHPIASLDAVDPLRAEYRTSADPLDIWMGDHSHSWLTGKEMLAWYSEAPSVVQVGILSRKEYEAWDGKSAPESYCGGVGGAGVVIVNDNAVEKEQTPGWTYIRCSWTTSLRDELGYFFDEVARLAKEHNQIRFVFGFDS